MIVRCFSEKFHKIASRCLLLAYYSNFHSASTLFYRLENPCRCNVMTYDDTYRNVCKSMN